MSQIMNIARSLKDDDNGATMVEYSLLIGLITVAVVAIIATVGTWITTQWTTLQTAIGAGGGG